MKMAQGCKCGKRMCLAADPEYCIWCGRGLCVLPVRRASARLRRLPWDLGAFVREGRRPDPHLENVVRLDRLRDRWKVPPAPSVGLTEVPPLVVEAFGLMTSREASVLAAYASGCTSRIQVADLLDVDTQAVTSAMVSVYRKLEIDPWRDGHKAARAAAIDWWLSVHSEELAA